jgi:hypothetical protein
VRDEIEQALAPLVGLPLWAVSRAADFVWFQFGERRRVPDGAKAGEREVGTYALQVACPWRLADAERILVGSGDLLTPADPEEEPETFAWDEPGASWLDVRLREVWDSFGGEPPSVRAVAADPLGGVRLTLGDGLVLELFANSTPSGHVSTEFWRLLRPGEAAPHVVVGTFGFAREEA